METWWKFTYQNHFVTENQNGPYGQYEHILQDGSWILRLKKWILDENWKLKISKNMKIWVPGSKIDFWGYIQDQNDI